MGFEVHRVGSPAEGRCDFRIDFDRGVACACGLYLNRGAHGQSRLGEGPRCLCSDESRAPAGVWLPSGKAIKFTPGYADQRDHLTLKATWTKGGKARTVPIRTAEQRAVLDRAHRLAGRGSLIPSDRNYAKQLRVYERHTANAGLSKLHGLRHAYAQVRYEELTGWRAPIAGDPTRRALNQQERATDHEARHLISLELGHESEAIMAIYLGR